MNRSIPAHVSLAIAAAVVGPDEIHRLLTAGMPYRVGVTAALPHDPERVRKAEEKRARKAARRAK